MTGKANRTRACRRATYSDQSPIHMDNTKAAKLSLSEISKNTVYVLYYILGAPRPPIRQPLPSMIRPCLRLAVIFVQLLSLSPMQRNVTHAKKRPLLNNIKSSTTYKKSCVVSYSEIFLYLMNLRSWIASRYDFEQSLKHDMKWRACHHICLNNALTFAS